MTDSPRLIYFADTMCSWCYGFAPEMNRVMIAVSDRVELILQSGGLRPFLVLASSSSDATMKPRTSCSPVATINSFVPG